MLPCHGCFRTMYIRSSRYISSKAGLEPIVCLGSPALRLVRRWRRWCHERTAHLALSIGFMVVILWPILRACLLLLLSSGMLLWNLWEGSWGRSWSAPTNVMLTWFLYRQSAHILPSTTSCHGQLFAGSSIGDILSREG